MKTKFRIQNSHSKFEIQDSRFFFPKDNQKGFTLIEIMVVIVIIGIFAAIIWGALRLSFAKARDARRQTDLEVVQTALDLWRHDNSSDEYQFPHPHENDNLSSVNEKNTKLNMLKDYLTGKEIPKDPKSGQYKYTSLNGNSYRATAVMEQTRDWDHNPNTPPNNEFFVTFTINPE